jgi:hypothetical protein
MLPLRQAIKSDENYENQASKSREVILENNVVKLAWLSSKQPWEKLVLVTALK